MRRGPVWPNQTETSTSQDRGHNHSDFHLELPGAWHFCHAMCSRILQYSSDRMARDNLTDSKWTECKQASLEKQLETRDLMEIQRRYGSVLSCAETIEKDIFSQKIAVVWFRLMDTSSVQHEPESTFMPDQKQQQDRCPTHEAGTFASHKSLSQKLSGELMRLSMPRP